MPDRDTRVLVVDDDSGARGGLARLLGVEGFHTRVACSGDEALALVAAESADVIRVQLEPDPGS